MLEYNPFKSYEDYKEEASIKKNVPGWEIWTPPERIEELKKRDVDPEQIRIDDWHRATKYQKEEWKSSMKEIFDVWKA